MQPGDVSAFCLHDGSGTTRGSETCGRIQVDERAQGRQEPGRPQPPSVAIHHAGVPADLEDDCRVVIRVPDPLMEEVGAREELTFDERREIDTCSRTLLGAVEEFVDAMLDVFERRDVNRLDPSAQSSSSNDGSS